MHRAKTSRGKCDVQKTENSTETPTGRRIKYGRTRSAPNIIYASRTRSSNSSALRACSSTSTARFATLNRTSSTATSRQVMNCHEAISHTGFRILEFQITTKTFKSTQQQPRNSHMFARNATDYDTVFFVIVPETDVPRPLLDEAGCPDGKQLGCADGTCLPDDYFCDGSVDCPDGSDEGYCDVDNDPNSATPCNPTTCTPPDCFCSRDGKKQQRNITTATNFTL